MQQQVPQHDPLGAQQLQQQQMVLCPVRVVYETQIFLPPDQIQPNQTLFINTPQNPPPWAAAPRQTSNQVYFVQQMPGNIMPPLQPQVDQNQIYLHQYSQYQQGVQMLQQQMMPNLQQENRSVMPNLIPQNLLQNYQNLPSALPSNLNQNIPIPDRMPQQNFGQLHQSLNANVQIQQQMNLSANNVLGRQNDPMTSVHSQTNQFTQKVDLKPNYIGQIHQNVPRTQPQVLTVSPIQNLPTTTNVPTFSPNLVRQVKTESVASQSTPTYVNASQNTNVSRIRKVTPTPNKITPTVTMRNVGQTQTYRPIQPRPNQQYRVPIPNFSVEQPIVQNPTPILSQSVMNVHTNLPVTTNTASFSRTDDFNRKRKSESPDDNNKKLAAIQVNMASMNQANSSNQVGNIANQIGHSSNQVGNIANQIGNSSNQVGNMANQIGNSSNQVGNIANQIGNSSNQVGNITNLANNLTNPVNSITNQLNVTNLGNNLTNPMNNLTNPLNNLTNPLNNLTIQQNNLTNSQNNLTNPLNNSTNQLNNLTRTSAEIGINTSPLQRNLMTVTSNSAQDTTKIEMTQPIYTMTTDGQNITYFLPNVPDTTNQAIRTSVDQQQTDDMIRITITNKDKLIRNTVYTQARGRLMTEKEAYNVLTQSSVAEPTPNYRDTPTTSTIKLPTEPIRTNDPSDVASDTTPEGDSTSIGSMNEDGVSQSEDTNDTQNESVAEELSQESTESADMGVKLNTTNNKGMFPVERAGRPEKEFILTHVLDGIVIQESNVAFPIREPLIKRITQTRSQAANEVRTAEKEVNRIESTSRVDEASGSTAHSATETVVPQGDNPFHNLSATTVKLWTTQELASHLSQHGWEQAASLFIDHEIDGESLCLVSKAQLQNIGVKEEQADIVCEFVKS